MKEREQNNLPQDNDRHLDLPQEARSDKHINFMDVEDTSDDNERRNQTDEERAKWQNSAEKAWKKAGKQEEIQHDQY